MAGIETSDKDNAPRLRTRISGWVRANRKEAWFLVGLLSVSWLLLFFNIGNTMHFAGDESRDAFIVRDLIRHGDMPLLGPSVSIGDMSFRLGPAFYYVLAPGYLLFGGSPVGGAVIVAFLSWLSVLLLYVFVRKISGVRVAAISSALYAVSMMMVQYGRWAWNPNPLPFFVMALFVIFLALAKKECRRRTALAILFGVCFGIAIQLHGTALFAFPFIVLAFFIVARIKLKWHHYAAGVFAFLFVNLPQIIYEAQNNFSNVKLILNVVRAGNSEHHTFWWRMLHTAGQFRDFFYEALLQEQLKALTVVFCFLAFGVILWRVMRSVREHRRDIGGWMLLLWIGIPYIIYHAFQSQMFPHYFMIIFPFPFICIALAIDLLWKKKYIRSIALAAVVAYAALSLYQSGTFLYDLRSHGSRVTSHKLTLQDMQDVLKIIRSDAGLSPISIRTLPIDYQKGFSYLSEESGIAVNAEAGTVYTIVSEKEAAIPIELRKETNIFARDENVAIYKEEQID